MPYKNAVEKLFNKFISESDTSNNVDIKKLLLDTYVPKPRHEIEDYKILVTFLSNYDPLNEVSLWKGLATGELNERKLTTMFTSIEIIEEKKFDEGYGYIAKVVGGHFEQLAYNRYPDYKMGYTHPKDYTNQLLNGIWHLIDDETNEPYPFPSHELLDIVSKLSFSGYSEVAISLIEQTAAYYKIDESLTNKVYKAINKISVLPY